MAGDDAAKSPPPPKLDPSFPYYLGPQDRPGDVLTLNRLRADNYDDWAADIQNALVARRKFCFLNGSITAHLLHAPLPIGRLFKPCFFHG